MIKKCQEDENFKKSIVEKYIKNASVKDIIDEMETMLKNVSDYKNIEDNKSLKIDIIFNRLAYGFLPSEYVGFKLKDKSCIEKQTFISDIATFKSVSYTHLTLPTICSV